MVGLFFYGINDLNYYKKINAVLRTALKGHKYKIIDQKSERFIRKKNYLVLPISSFIKMITFNIKQEQNDSKDIFSYFTRGHP